MKFSNSMTLQVFHDLYEPCYILSKFKLLNTDTPLVWTLYGPLSVGINGFGCTSHLAGTPNWHPVLEKISPKIDTPF